VRRDALLPSEISRCYKSKIAAESSHQPREIGNAGADVLIDHEAAANAECYCCGGHQLHDPGGSLRRDCGGLPPRLDLNHGMDQLPRDAVAVGVEVGVLDGGCAGLGVCDHGGRQTEQQLRKNHSRHRSQ